MPTENPGVAADAAAQESTQATGATAVADAADEHAPLTGKAAPAEADPAIPPSLEVPVGDLKDEEITQLLEQIESGVDPFAETPAPENDAHVEDDAGETGDGEQRTETTAETDHEDDGEAEGDEPSVTVKKRVRINYLEKDNQIALTRALEIQRKNPDGDFRDVLKRVGLSMPAETVKAADAAETIEAEAEAARAPESILSAAQKKLDDLETKYDEADEAFDKPAANKLRREIFLAQQEVADARAEVRSAATRVREQLTEHANRIAGAIPDFVEHGSQLNTLAKSMRAEIMETNPAFFNDPDSPMKLAKAVLIAADKAELIPLLNGRKPAPAQPANGTKPAAVPAAAQPRVAKRNGVPAAMLTTGNGGGKDGNIVNRIQAGVRVPQEEILKALEALS